MKCQELLALLPTETEEYVAGWEKETYQKIAVHIRACAVCCQGIARLSEAVIAEDVLSCDACRAHFPAYYEATHPVYSPSPPLADVDVVEVALHLGQCVACSEEYQVLVALWDVEEQQ